MGDADAGLIPLKSRGTSVHSAGTGRKQLRESDVPLFTEPEKIIKWFKTNFCRKECSHFIPTKEGGQQRCGCGRFMNQHEQSTAAGRNELWSSKKHTKELETDAFGLVSFSEAEQDAGIAAEYAKIADTTLPERIWLLLNRVWSLKSPTLVLSIIGGNRTTNLDATIKSSLEEGLAKVMQVTDTWIITGATNTTVTRTVSAAFHDHYRKGRETRNACIGIAPWGSIGWKEQLLGEMNEVLYIPENEGKHDTRSICKNHTHFLLVDDGSINQFGIERKFRLNLERFLSNSNGSKVVPCISILVEGGYTACMQIRENLKNNKQIPAVLMKGSGGLADVLQESIAGFKDDGLKGVRLQASIKEFVKEKMGFELQDQTNVAVTSAVKEIVERHIDQIVIYDPMQDPYGLHHAVMEASKASYSEGSKLKDKLSRLQLALHLDEMEIARRDIQNEAADVEYVKTALYKSIKQGKANFVEFLLKYGIDLKDFFSENKEILQKLYAKKLVRSQFLSVLLIQEDRKKIKKQGKFDLRIVDRLLDRYMEEDYSSVYSHGHAHHGNGVLSGITPIQELIIWAVFTDMFDMVECFWRHDTKRALENAIVVFRLYRAMSKKLKNIDEIKRSQLRSHSMKFQARATELLSAYYSENVELAIEVIKAPIPLWGNNNLISLAANGKAHDFVAHTCSQTYLNDLWRGERDWKTVKSEIAKVTRGFTRERREQKQINLKKRQYSFDYVDEGEHDRGVTCCGKFLQKIRNLFWFFFLVPKGKLYVNAFTYLVFLGCFSYDMLVVKEHDSKILWYLVHVFVAGMTIDEIREILEAHKKTVIVKYKDWFWSMWNRLDVLAILLFYVGFGISFKHPNAARVILAIDLVIWVTKYAHFYRMIRSLGPYLTMIYRMLFHMASFVLVLVTVVIAFGIFNHALLYPTIKISWEVLFRLLFRPYLLVFGELGVQAYTLSSNSTVFGTKKIDTSTEIVAVLGMCIYLLIANVLLLNMLIAAFNNIYEDVKENTVRIWRFDRYHMITEYMRKPFLPVPFSAISSIFRIFYYLCELTGKCHRFISTEYPGKDQVLEMEEFQHRCMKDFCRGEKQQAADFTPNTLKAVKDRVDGNSKALIELDEKIEERLGKLEDLLQSLKNKIDLLPSAEMT